jgi:hypothetical protein
MGIAARMENVAARASRVMRNAPVAKITNVNAVRVSTAAAARAASAAAKIRRATRRQAYARS